MMGAMACYPSCSSASYTNADLHAFVGCVERSPTVPVFTWNANRTIGCFLWGEPFVDGAHVSAANALVQLYEQSGLDCLLALNGWFSGVLVDLRQRRTLLFNDRYGLGRLYVHEAGGRTFFSSEAKSLLGVLPETRRLDPQGLGEWWSCGCVLQDRSLFSGISLLPPGSAWTFSAEGYLTKARYFDSASWESLPALSAEEYYERLKETFPRILKSYLNGSRPVAMSLTGGLDGRMIMSWSQRGPGELPCYTFNGPVRDCADVKIARKVAHVCGQPHHTIPVGEEFLAEFRKLAEDSIRISDGAMDVTGAAELYVNRLASEIAPVRLTGNYGSEILRRHVAFRPRGFASDLLAPEMTQRVQNAEQTYAAEACGNPLSFIAFKQVPWHHYARFVVERSQVAVRSPFLDNDLVRLAFQAPPEPATGLEPSLRLIGEGDPELGRIPTDRGITYPARRVANRVNRSLQEFLAKAEYAYDYGMPQWLTRLDQCVSPLRLERLFLGRQKFCHFRTWYRHQLAPVVKEVLLDPRSLSRPYLRGKQVAQITHEHTSGRRNHTLSIHKLLTAELIQRQLLEP